MSTKLSISTVAKDELREFADNAYSGATKLTILNPSLRFLSKFPIRYCSTTSKQNSYKKVTRAPSFPTQKLHNHDYLKTKQTTRAERSVDALNICVYRSL